MRPYQEQCFDTLNVQVLRLGHRIYRDKRVTTHLALVSRAFGASALHIAGEFDPEIYNVMKKVSHSWGGSLLINQVSDPLEFIASWINNKGIVVHLTMYGVPFQHVIDEIRVAAKSILVVVGGQKVPIEIYKLSDYNLSITSQPHSEISSLAVFLDNLFKGMELGLKFHGQRLTVVPSSRGKLVLKVF